MPPMPLIATELTRNIAIVYHRTLDGHIKKFPSYHLLTTQEAFERANTTKTLNGQPITIYTLQGQSVVPKSAFQRKDQDFASYATDWEKRASKLVSGSAWFRIDPLVDGDMLVVGHVGWVNAHFICISRRGFSATLRLTEMVEKNVDMVVVADAERDKTPPDYVRSVPYGSADADSYNVVTDMDGHLLAILGRRDARGLVADSFTPVDLILVPYLAGKAVALASRAAVLAGEAAASAAELGMGAKSAIWTLARRNAARLGGFSRKVASGVFRREVVVTEDIIVEKQVLARWAARGRQLRLPAEAGGSKSLAVGKFWREGVAEAEEFAGKSGSRGLQPPKTDLTQPPQHVMRPEPIPENVNKGFPELAKGKKWIHSTEGQEWCKTQKLDGATHAGPRDHDAEAKMFEDLLEKTSKDTTGEFHWKVDRPSCPACKDMIFRFTGMRRGIKVIQH